MLRFSETDSGGQARWACGVRVRPRDTWVATVRYSTGGRQYTETIPAERLRIPEK